MLESEDAGTGAEDGGPGEPGECPFKVRQRDDGAIVIDSLSGDWSFVGNSATAYYSEATRACDGFNELADRNHGVSASVDYDCIFSVGAPVYRSVQLISSAHEGTFGFEKEALSASLLDSDSGKMLSCCDSVQPTLHIHATPLTEFPRKNASLRYYPALPVTNHVFETAVEPDEAVARIMAWLDSKPQMFYEFCSSEVSWNCSHREFCSQQVFDLGIYKLPNAGRHQPKYVIELLRRGGDRLRINHLFNELKFLFADKNRVDVDANHSIEFPSSLLGSGDQMSELEPGFISEEKIKQTILLALQDASCDYSTKAEAIRLAGCIFAHFNGNSTSVSSIDRDIVEAVASLRHSNSMFDWVAIPPAVGAVECH